MKTYKALTKEIETNSARIKEIDEALKEKGLDVEKIAELCKAREELTITNQILRDNKAYVLAFDGLKALKEVIAKYNGKSYGDATQKAVFNEMYKRGYYFHFSRSYFGKDASEATFTNAGAGYHGTEGKLYANYETENGKTKRRDFITTENKVDLLAIESAKISGSYCDNPKKRTREILKAYKKYQEKVAAAGAAQSELNALLPVSRDSFHNVNIYVSNI